MEIPCQYQNPGQLCDICKKVRFEIPVIQKAKVWITLRITSGPDTFQASTALNGKIRE